MIELEKFPCADKFEACKRERYYIEKLKATLNTQIPSRFKCTLYNGDKCDITEYNLLYQKHNKEKIYKRKSAQYACECGLTFNYGHKERHFKKQQHINYFQGEPFEYKYYFEDGTECTEFDYNSNLL